MKFSLSGIGNFGNRIGIRKFCSIVFCSCGGVDGNILLVGLFIEYI